MAPLPNSTSFCPKYMNKNNRNAVWQFMKTVGPSFRATWSIDLYQQSRSLFINHVLHKSEYRNSICCIVNPQWINHLRRIGSSAGTMSTRLLLQTSFCLYDAYYIIFYMVMYTVCMNSYHWNMNDPMMPRGVAYAYC